MRGSLVCCVITCAVAGCWHDHRDDFDACGVVLVRPGNIDEEVAIRPTLRLEWSTAVRVGDARVTLRSIDGSEVPVTLFPESDRVASVTTDHSLRFDTVYTLEVEPVAARDREGGMCVGSTTAFHTVTPYEVEQPLRMASLEGLARIDDFVIGSSRAYRGLQVFDIAQPDSPVLVATMPTDEHPAGIVVHGRRAYVPTDHDGVIIVDVTSPAAPTRVGRVGTPGTALGVAAFEGGGSTFIAIADGVEGVRIVDVTDPVAPRTVSVFDPSGARAADVRSVDVEGNLMAVADGAHGYVAVDLTDPANPVRIGNGYADRAAIDVAIHGGLIYVAHFPGFIDVYDPQSAALPRVGGVRACDVCMQRYPAYLHEAGDRLYATAAREGVRTYALDGNGGMTLAGIRSTPGPAFAIVETDERVYVGEEGGLVGYDRASFGAPLFFDQTGHGNASSIAVAGDLAYVAAASRGLQVFDLSEPEQPKIAASIATPASTSGDTSAGFVTLIADELIVGDVRGGLVTFDRSSAPMAPAILGQVQPTDGVLKVVSVRPGVVLGCQGNTGMFLADISDPGAPVLLAERFFNDLTPSVPDFCNDLVYDDSTKIAYVAGNMGITLLELGTDEASDPLRLVGRHALPSRDAVVSVARRGRILYAATRVADFEGRNGATHRLQVLDLIDPLAPRWLSASDGDLGGIGALTVVDDKLFSAARDLGVYVFDLSTPEAPTVEYLVATRGDALSLAATGETLYVAESAGGLGVIHTGPLAVNRD